MTASVKNLWTLDKHPSIRAILIMLQHEVGPEGFMLLDEEDLNEKAVRIITPYNQRELAVYIYSYAQREERYGLDLEFPYLIETRADDQTIRLNDLTALEVVEKTMEHLEMKNKRQP